MTKIRTACQKHQAGAKAVKCLSKKHNKAVQIGFELKPC